MGSISGHGSGGAGARGARTRHAGLARLLRNGAHLHKFCRWGVPPHGALFRSLTL